MNATRRSRWLVLTALISAACGGGSGKGPSPTGNDDGACEDTGGCSDDDDSGGDDTGEPTDDDDDDPCARLNCDFGCDGGECLPAPCEDECAAGSLECATADSIRTCGYYDGDSCTEWGSPRACGGSEAACRDDECVELVDMTWQLIDWVNDGAAIDYRFFTDDCSRVWPSSTRFYYTQGYGVITYSILACYPGEVICYGASPSYDYSIYWGVDLYCGSNCSSTCCAVCGASNPPIIGLYP